MANENEYSNIQIGGYVPQRILGKRDLTPLQNYFTARNQMWDDTIKQKSAIDVAIGNLKLNSAEDKWKYDYARRIQKKIDDAATYGDYSRALDTATLEAAKAVSSPEIMGRIRANENYEKAKQEVNARQDINSLTKERWLAQNKYHYEDTYDDEGNIVGGTDWQADWNPVRRVQIEKLITLAGQLAAPVKRASSSSSSTQVSDEQGVNGGRSVGTPDGLSSVKLGYGRSSSSGYTRETLTKEKLDEVYNELFKLDPDNMNSLQQDYDDLSWKVNRLENKLDSTTDEAERLRLSKELEGYKNDIYDNNGQVLSVKDYMLSKVGLITKNMAYDNISNSSSSGSSVTRGLRYTDKAGYASGTSGLNDLSPIPSSEGTAKSSPAVSSYLTGGGGFNVNTTTKTFESYNMFNE